MGKKIIQLIEKIKRIRLSEWEESLIHDHIHIEFEDYYFSNREYRRVMNENMGVGGGYSITHNMGL